MFQEAIGDTRDIDNTHSSSTWHLMGVCELWQEVYTICATAQLIPCGVWTTILPGKLCGLNNILLSSVDNRAHLGATIKI